jgi:hypothetical protein
LANSTKGTGILILENSHSMLKGGIDSPNYLGSFSLFKGSKTSCTLGMSGVSLALSLG